jgi:tRNA pseudouridine32 synthase / 23S rRNA pseudouridine746 synthase
MMNTDAGRLFRTFRRTATPCRPAMASPLRARRELVHVAAMMPTLTPDSLRARVLHEDPWLFVIDKPAGLAVHKSGRIVDHLELYLPALADADGAPPKLAHRLDRDTAGCLILGRSLWSLKRLGAMFAAGHVAKTYWAVADGVPNTPQGVIDLPLLKITEPGAWNILPDPTGQPAITEYRVLGVDSERRRSWLELTPRTGRTHQLRVHCAAIGCPLIGEPFYGPERIAPGNLHLVARSVSFQLAHQYQPVTAVAPPPSHMVEALTACGWQAST